MSVFDLICQAEARRRQLQDRHDQLTPREREDLRNLPDILDTLWKRRRCEISGATMAEPPSFREDRRGLGSVTRTIGQRTGQRAILMGVE